MLAKGLARFFSQLLLLTLAGSFLGCTSGIRYTPEQELMYIKPTVAVERFENRAPVDLPWQLEDAIAEQLTERLVQTRRYEVLAYGPLRPMPVPQVGINNPNPAAQNGSSAAVKEADYIVRGVITDFGFTEGPNGMLSAFSADKYAVVRAIIHVVDMANGSIKSSQTIEARIPNQDQDADVVYEQMAFGSYVFNRTALGQATNKMLDDAIASVAASIEQRTWQPKIASVMDNSVVINGGSNRGVQRGSVYVVRSASHQVYDPDESDPLGHVAGGMIGRVRIIQVTERFAIAEVISGSGFNPGQTLFISDFTSSRHSVRSSNY